MIWLDLCWGVPIKRDSGVFQSIQVSLVLQLPAAGEAENLQACSRQECPRNVPGNHTTVDRLKIFKSCS